jgi:hypothetical protein
MLKSILVILLILGLQHVSYSQVGPHQHQSLRSKIKHYREERKKWKEERAKEREEEKRIREYHKRIQSKEVFSRMKKSKEKALRNNSHQREPFLNRLFQKKRGRGVKQPKEKSMKVKQY